MNDLQVAFEGTLFGVLVGVGLCGALAVLAKVIKKFTGEK